MKINKWAESIRTRRFGIAYVIWSGVGIMLISLVGMFVFKQVPDLPTIIGMVLIVAGVVVINVFSKSSVH